MVAKAVAIGDWGGGGDSRVGMWISFCSRLCRFAVEVAAGTLLDRGELWERVEPDGGRERPEDDVDGEGGAGREEVREFKDGRVVSFWRESGPILFEVGVADIVQSCASGTRADVEWCRELISIYGQIN